MTTIIRSVRSILSAFICLALSAVSQAESIFPMPKEIGMKKGVSYEIQKVTPVFFDKGLSKEFAEISTAQLQKVSGSTFKATSDKNAAYAVVFELEKGLKLAKEAYILDVSEKRISVRASHEAGLFYGMQTLSQILANGSSVPLYVIKDEPRYAYRGLHLDVSRHFFDVDFVKRYIDMMALYKYNVFHWHLSDDDGWRIESKLYPKLTEVGAYRKKVGRPVNQAKKLNVDDGKPYGGFYTQEQVKEIIAYAKARNIEVIPEIDVPGHSAAIIKAYPELGASHDVLNIGKPETIKFLEDIFTEVAGLFPSKYVHIGCDEVGLGAWKKNADCIAKMKELGTDNPHDLHRWLVHHLHDHLVKQKKQSMAWCEVLDAKVKKDVLVMCWRDNHGWVKAPKLGHQIVVTPSMQAYFNYREDVGTLAPGHGGYRTVIEKVYNFDPTDDSLTDEQKKLVLGGQGCVWTEFIPKPEHVEYITFPRAIALSEALWSPKEKKNFSTLHERLVSQYKYMDKFEIRYAVLAPVAKDLKVKFAGNTKLTLTNPNQHGTIHYTLDGSEPDVSSPTYSEGGINVDQSCTVKAVVVFTKEQKSYSVSIECTKEAPLTGIKVGKVEQGVHSASIRFNTSEAHKMMYPYLEKKNDGLFRGGVGKAGDLVEDNCLLKVSEPATYQFRFNRLVAKAFLHGKPIRNGGTYTLAKGLHPITVVYHLGGENKGDAVTLSKDGKELSIAERDKMLFRDPSTKRYGYVFAFSNKSFQAKHPLQNSLDGNADTFAWTKGGVKPGDVITFQLNTLKALKSIKILTGKKNGGDKLEGADLEVSADGKTFKKVADFTGGVASATPDGKVAAIRIKVIRPQGTWLVIRSVELEE